MKCPYCDKEMTPGFVQGSRGFFFTEEKHSVWFWPNTSKGDFFLSSNNYTLPSCAAYHCSDCKKVVISCTE